MEAREEYIQNLERMKREILHKAEQQCAEIEKTIAWVRSQAEEGTAERATLNEGQANPVKPGQYRGMKTAAALQAYLLQRGGGPIRLERSAADLQVAGVKLAEDENRDPVTNLKITVSMNPKKFRYNKGSNTVELKTEGKPD